MSTQQTHEPSTKSSRPSQIPPGDAGIEEAIAQVRSEPSSEKAWEHLERTAANSQRPEDVASLYRDVLGGEALEEEAVSVIGQKAVQYHEEWFGEDASELTDLLRTILRRPSAPQWAYQRLTVRYTMDERWDDLFDLYDRMLRNASSESQKLTLLAEAAQTAKDFAGQPERAIKYLEAHLELRPTDAQTTAAIERLYERQERWPDLVRFLEKRAPFAGDQADEYYRRAALLSFETVGDFAGTMERCRRIYADGTDTEFAVNLAERVLQTENADTESRMQALGLLREFYLEAGRNEDLERVLSAALQFADPEARRALLREAAAHAQTTDAPERALEHFAGLLELDPSATDARRALQRLATGEAQLNRRQQALVRAAENAALSTERLGLRLEAASVRTELGDDAAAAQLYREILDEGAEEREAALQAARGLAAAYERLEQPEDRLVVLENIGSLETDTSERRKALGEAARLAEELGHVDRALTCWQGRLDVDGEDLEALNGAIELLEREKRWEPLVSMLERRSELGDDAKKRSDRMKIARVVQEELGDAHRAIAIWKDVAEQSGEDTQSTAKLSELYALTNQWQELASLLGRTVQREQGHLAEVLCRLGDTYRVELGDAARALEAYREVLAIEVSNERAQEGLRAFVDDPELGPRAIDILHGAYEASGRWNQGLELLDARLRNSSSDRERARILCDAAATVEAHDEDLRATLELLCRALPLDPEREDVLARLVELAEKTESWGAAAEAIGKASEALGTSSRAASLRVKQATILAEHSEDQQKTLAAWIEALRVDPANESAADAVATLGLEPWGWDAAQAALTAAVETDIASVRAVQGLVELRRQRPGASLVEALLRLFEARPRNLDPLWDAAQLAGADPELLGASGHPVERLYEESARMWRREIDVTGERTAAEAACWAIDRMVDLAEQAEDYRRAVALRREAAALPAEEAYTLSHLQAAAATLSERLDDVEGAVEVLSRVWQARPEDASLRDQVAGLYERLERFADLLALRRRQMESASDNEKLALRLEVSRVAGIVESRAGRLGMLEANLQQQPGHAPTIEAISALLSGSSRYQELATVLETQARLVGSTPEAAQLWYDAALLAENQLGDLDRATAAYTQVTELAAGRIDAIDALARISEARADHDERARWLEVRVQHASEEERDPICLQLADAYLKTSRHDEALTLLESVQRTGSASDEVRRHLIAHYRDTQALEPLAHLLLAGLEQDPESVTLPELREAASIYVEKLGLPALAVPALRRAHALDNNDRWVSSTLAEALHANGELSEARTVLEALVASYGRRRSAERAGVHGQLASILRKQGEISEALGHLEQASSMDARNGKVLRELGDLAREAGDLEKADKAYRALLMVVRRQADQAQGPCASEVLLSLHQTALSRGDETQAKELLESAFESASHDERETVRFAQVLVAAERPELGVQAIEARVAATEDGREQARLLHKLTEIVDVHLHDPQAAFDRALESLERAPDLLDAHPAARKLAQRTEQTDRYLESVSKIIERLRRQDDAQLAGRLLIQMGLAAEENMGDLDAAVEFYRRAEEKVLHPAEAWLALARVANARGNQDEELQVLERVAAEDGVSPSVRAGALYRLAELLLPSPDRRHEGVNALERALKLSADYPRAGALLEGVVSADSTPEAAALYEKVARSAGSDTLLLGFLQWKVSSGNASSRELHEAVERARAVSDHGRLRSLLEGGVSSFRNGDTTTFQWALQQLATLCEQEGQWAEASHSWAESAEAASSDAVAQLRIRAATAAEKAGDLASAASFYERVLQDGCEKQDELWAPILRVCRKLGDEDRLNWVVGSALDALGDPSSRNAIRMEWAEHLASQEERVHDAIQVLRDVLDEEPGHAAATGVLASLYEAIGFSEDLVELIRGQLDAALENKDGEAIEALALRLGALLERVSADEAADTYRRALAVDPTRRALIEALAQLTHPERDPRGWAEVQQLRLGQESGKEAADLALKVRGLWERLDDNHGIERSLQLGYQRCPEDHRLQEALEQWYRSQENWTGLAAFLLDEANRLGASDGSVARLLEAARIYEEHLGSLAEAVSVLKQAWSLDQDRVDVLGRLCSALAVSGEHDAALEVLSEALERPLEASQRYILLQTRAQLAMSSGRSADAVRDLEEAYQGLGSEVSGQLVEALKAMRQSAQANGDTQQEQTAFARLVDVLTETRQQEAASEILAEWVERDPSNIDALRRLLKILWRAQQWQEAATAASKLVRLEEGEPQIAVTLQLYEACAQLDDVTQARPSLEFVARQQPDSEPIFDRLQALYQSSGAYVELGKLLIQRATHTEDDEARFERWREAGKILAGPAEQPDLALEALENALAVHPDDHECVLALVDAYIGTERFAEAGQRLEAAIEAHPRRRSPALSELQHRMARLARAVGDRSLEAQWLGAAIESDKNNAVAAAELAELAIELGDQDMALSALRAITLMKTEGPMSRAMAFLWQARIAHDRKERRRAVLWARKAQQEDPNLTEAREFLEAIGEK